MRCAFVYRAPRDRRVVVSHRVRLVAPALQPARARPGLSLPVFRTCAPPTRERRRSSGNRPPAQHTSSGIRHLSRQLCHLPGRRAPDALRVFQPTNLSWLACTTLNQVKIDSLYHIVLMRLNWVGESISYPTVLE